MAFEPGVGGDNCGNSDQFSSICGARTVAEGREPQSVKANISERRPRWRRLWRAMRLRLLAKKGPGTGAAKVDPPSANLFRAVVAEMARALRTGPLQQGRGV